MEQNDPEKGTFKESKAKELNDLYYIIDVVLCPLERKDNFKKQLEKFRDNISYSLEQVDNNVGLQSIELPKDLTDEEIAKMPEFVRKLDKLADEWSENLKKAQRALNEELPKNIKSASVEIDNRRRAVSNWSILAQQLESENISRIIRILDKSEESNRRQILNSNIQMFKKTFEDAVDYNKFLTTLERSIKDLSSDNLATIEHSISGIFHNLKIIYMISRHTEYEKFGFLMQVMASEICQKISEKIKLKEIFKSDPEKIDESINLINQSMSVVEKWRTCYTETRSKTKWEFQSKEITGPTEYIYKICNRLKSGLIKIKDFLKFLGPELKRVIGGSSDLIDINREKVFKAYQYIENYPYDIFDRQNDTSCNSSFLKFDKEMESLEEDTIQLIHITFKNLRSAESAFDLYTNFENLINQKNIKKTMREKYIDILEQFMKEIKEYSDLFEKNKDNPPISKAKSDVAGKIAWARQIFLKMKRPINKIYTTQRNLQSNREEADSENEKDKKEHELKNAFLEISRKLLSYESEIYNKWKAEHERSFIGYLHNNILKKVNEDSNSIEHYEVNFEIGLKLMIRNTKFLDLYGFSDIPKNIINIAHQEVLLAKYCNMLNNMLREYEAFHLSLHSRHHDLLSDDLKNLKEKISIGTTSHNWTSLGIEEFINECIFAIKVLRDKACTVFKSEEKIKNIIKQISNAQFVRELDTIKNMNRELSQFKNYYDDHRLKVISDLLIKYDEITDILKDIEKFTFENNDGGVKLGNKVETLGERKEMASYYRYWETSLLNALTKSVLRAMITLNEIFKIPRSNTNNLFNNSLFVMKSKFVSSKDILYNPNTADIDRQLKLLITSFQKSGNDFIRWMNGTCKKPERLKELSDERYEQISNRYSYGTEIEFNKEIKCIGSDLISTIGRIASSLKHNSDKYIAEYNIDLFGTWGQSAQSIMERKLERDKSLKNFEINLDNSLKYLNEFKFRFVSRRPCEGNSIINNEELNIKGVDQLRNVMNDMLKILVRQIEDPDIKQFLKKIESDKAKLNQKITDSESLKSVLDNISKINDKKLEMELYLEEIHSKLHFLGLHNYPELGDLKNKFILIKKEWNNLRVKAKKKDDKLLTKKKNLADETKAEAEKLKLEVETVYKVWTEQGPLTDKNDMTTGYNLLREYNKKLEIFKDRKDNIVQCQKLFNLEITSFPQINEMYDKNNKIEQLYKYFKEFNDFYEEQCARAWSKIELAGLTKKNDEFIQKMREFGKTLSSYPPYHKLDIIKDNFSEFLKEIITPLKEPIITERNMKDLLKELCRSIVFNWNTTTLKEIINLNLIKDKEKVQSIVADASKENEIKIRLTGIDNELNGLNFQMKTHKDKDTYIFKDVSKAVELLGENLTNLQEFSNNKFASAFKSQINAFEQETNLMMEIIEIWVEVQKKWMYLESIFSGSEDIKQKLPEETKEFEEYDKKFRILMSNLYKKPLIRIQCKTERKAELLKILSKYENAEKKLTDHLDSKKTEFSRFYFLTEPDLLQILGSTDTLTTLNPHMIKMYENCKELLSEKRGYITGMKSQEGETLIFRPVKMEQQVGVWMNRVDDEMKNRLRILTKDAIQDYTKEDLVKFIRGKLGQVIINTIECWWTFSIEDVFRKVKYESDKYAMKKELERQTTNLQALVRVVRMSDLSSQDRLKVNNLIIRAVHGREIVDNFVRDSILDPREFEWESQLKFSWDKLKDDMIIRQTNGEFMSCYEYQGLQGRLVVTPLTDRCVMTLTTALTFFLGSAPAGPAGTGKTETVKDLGKGLGIRVVVQNCTDSLDYLFMGQFFSGLSQTGFWGCFDEFNRINPEVLSVITTQIKTIQTALAQKKESWILQTKEIKLLPTIGIYITMNPNYEGRSELPDNLKALFRPVTMVTPDQLMICENLLLSEGFYDSKKLACKIDKLYQLCKEQLSKQHHYDWGLRTIKAVLSSAGILKRNYPDLSEDLILMRAMKDINMPKFIRDDAILFEGLIKDLFPNLDTSQENQEEFKLMVIETMKSLKYETIPGQVSKVMQMYEVMSIRHTTMICGPSMSGKSVILEVLKKTIENLKNTTIVSYLINPKAQNIQRLYGKKDQITGDFEIGILANIFLIANQPANRNELRWIILDGDVDSKWIENMNSVMDDSKQLTLENKDRILLQKYCSLLLESSNIHHATQATISRLGMIYVDSSILTPEAVANRWLESKHASEWDDLVRENLWELFRKYIPPAIKFVLKGARGNEELGTPLRLMIKQSEAAMVNQHCALLSSIIPVDNPPSDAAQLEQLFVFCLVWSVGACIASEDREKFNKFIRDISVGLPLPSNIYDKFWHMKMAKFEDWDNPLLNIIHEETGLGKKFNEIIIPTTDTKKYSWLLGQMINSRKPCLFVGESGTGKTITIQNFLSNLTNDKEKMHKYLIQRMNFSSRTSASDFHNTLEEVIDVRFIRQMGPPSGKQLIVFIDDLGMPTVDKYETQEPIAFLKLLIEKECYYKDNKDLIKLLDTNFIGATLPPGGGNNKIDPRFIALFNVFNITSEQNAVQKIFNVILANFLKVYPVDSEVMPLKETFITATSELFNRVKENLPRTPVKFHYIFNIRDISKVFQGFCQLTAEKFPSAESAVLLWRNESLRVFADKLLTINDKSIVNKLIEDIIKKNFNEYAEYALQEPCLVADFMKVNFYEENLSSNENQDNVPSYAPRFYEPITDYNTLKSFLETAIDAYKDLMNNIMDLVFYNDCMDHILRIHRIIRIERGNALLIGIGGSGKQSLAILATFIAQYELWTLTITSRFDEKQFKAQLVELFMKFVEINAGPGAGAGVAPTPICFLFTDEQVLDEGFMELINNILTTGIVPAIFEKAQKDAIVERWKSEAVRLNLQETKDVAYSLFVNKIRENLHMIICMSPSGDKLRVRSRNFPGLISNTTIDWFFEWPKEALSSVGSFILQPYKSLPIETKSTLIEHMVEVHLSIREYSNLALQSQKRYIYTTPKNFLDYIKLFKEIYDKYSQRVSQQISRLEKGLEVISKGAADIEILKTTVQEEEQKVAEFLIKLEGLKIELEIKNKLCKENTDDAREKEAYLSEKTIQITKEHKMIEENVEDMEKLIEQIKNTVKDINRTDVDQISKVQHFDNDNGTILKAVYFSLKQNPNKWDNVADGDISIMLSSSKLINFMKDIEDTYIKISSNLWQTSVASAKVSGIKVKQGNTVIQLLQNWVINFDKFCKKNKEKIEQENTLKIKIEEKMNAEQGLNETKTNLEILTKEQIELHTEKTQKDKEYQETNEKLKSLREILEAATGLFEGLKSEQLRWGIDKEDLINNKTKLIGDCILSSAFLSYCGPFSFEFRKRMIYTDWKEDIISKNITVSDNFLVQELLASQQMISQWNLEGLPDDELSIQNGILTENALRWPLCIDPEMQAIQWIKKKKQGSLKVITFNNENYMKFVIGAIKNGGSILIENLDESIDPNINPVLEKNYKEKAGITKIFLDGNEIDVDSNFRMYMTSKISNPHYTPEIMAKTVVINYSVTMEGLEDQLLNEVVRHEYPEVEETRRKLIDTMNTNKITLKNCEDSLLSALNASLGSNLLENKELIETLKKTKTKAKEINISLEISEQTKKTIYLQRDNYKPVAKRGSILYFAMTSMRLISTMYEYSLGAFLGVYRNSLVNAKKEANTILANRLKQIQRTLTQLVYEYTCLSIFEKHKLMFSFHMQTMIMKYEEGLNQAELLFFLRGNLLKARERNPFNWLPDLSWQDLDGLSALPSSVFSDLSNDFRKNEIVFKNWFDLEKPEDANLPLDYEKRLTILQKLLIIRVFRKDRIYNAIKVFISTLSSDFFINAPVINMDKIFDQSNEKTPILFIISPGVDPSSFVSQLAIKKGFLEKKFRQISLGQKQEREATDMIQDGVKRGLWILLQNCDLLQKWLKDLENIIENFDKPKPDFRLWLTTSPIKDFPIGILQKSFKVVTEPPDGLRLNINRVYNTINEDTFESESSHSAFKPILHVLSFFHAVLQDRKKFGKIGWNIIYDFSESDFIISKRLVGMYLNKLGPDDAVPWASLKYLIGEAMYGGRVTDEYDRRIMMTYLNEYMGDFIFDINQKFFFSRTGFDFQIPENGPYESYIKAIGEMPTIYSPEVIGLSSNAEIDYFTQASKLICSNLLMLQESNTSKFQKNENEVGTDTNQKASTKEQFVLDLANDIISKTPEKFDLISVNKKFAGPRSPIDSVLVQEIERYNTLNEKIRTSLDELIKSLNGEISMNSEIEEIMNCLFNGVLPEQWRKLAPETQKLLGNWIDHYHKRYLQYENWLKNGEPKVIWLSGLHIPASYLKAIIQVTSSMKHWALDKVDTYTVVSKFISPDEIKEKLQYGCYIYGCYLEGAEWNVSENKLERQPLKKLLCEMPLIQVIPAEASKIKLRNNLKTPVYMTQNRRNVQGNGLVFEADLRTFEHPNTWILQGVALVLNTYYS